MLTRGSGREVGRVEELLALVLALVECRSELRDTSTRVRSSAEIGSEGEVSLALIGRLLCTQPGLTRHDEAHEGARGLCGESDQHCFGLQLDQSKLGKRDLIRQVGAINRLLRTTPLLN